MAVPVPDAVVLCHVAVTRNRPLFRQRLFASGVHGPEPRKPALCRDPRTTLLSFVRPSVIVAAARMPPEGTDVASFTPTVIRQPSFKGRPDSGFPTLRRDFRATV